MTASENQTKFCSSFRDLTYFHQRNVSVLLGRAFSRLMTEEGLTLPTLARCFGFTKENARQLIKLYSQNRHLFDSPTLVPSELGADTTSVPSKRCEASNSPADQTGQTTVGGAFCVSKISDERSAK